MWLSHLLLSIAIHRVSVLILCAGRHWMTGWPGLPRRPGRHLPLTTSMEHSIGLRLAHEVWVCMRVHKLTITAWHRPRLLLLHEAWGTMSHEWPCIEMMRFWHIKLLVSSVRLLKHRCWTVLRHSWRSWWGIVLLLTVRRLILPVVSLHLGWIVDLWRLLVSAWLRRLILHLVDHFLQECDQLFFLSARFTSVE